MILIIIILLRLHQSLDLMKRIQKEKHTYDSV